MKRFKHNLSHYRLLTGNMMQFLPVGCVEVLPGDTFQHRSDVMIRVSPLAAPVMHPVHVRLHHFYIQNRQHWSSWEDFITGGPDGTNSDTVPTINTVADSITEHLYGINTASIAVNAIPLYGVNAIWNEYYRDQDLMTERTSTDTSIPNIAWEKDYLTTARPWADKGDDVTLPVGSVAPVVSTGDPIRLQGATEQTDRFFQVQSADDETQLQGFTGGANENLIFGGTTGLEANLSAATAIPLNDFRRALALQRYQEARARYGSRYVEYLRYLGIQSSDGRLDRPIYLGGGKTTINFSEVLQTAPETGTSPTNAYGVGDMYGHGVAALRSNGYRYFFEEHGFVISILTVRPKAIYANSVHRSFLRQDKEDYFQRELQFIGQQPVYDNEVYADSGNTSADIFGYNDRYAEYRSHPSSVVGDFLSDLDHYHQARIFGSAPTLNSDFVSGDATKRIHNVTARDALWVAVNHNIAARRLVSRSAYAKTI
jgi:hypothetical protein